MSENLQGKNPKKALWHSIAGGVFLIGLAVLFYFGSFWPWILALIGLMVIIKGVAEYYSRKGE